MRGTLSWILLCAMLVALLGVPVGAQATSVQAAPLYTQSGSADGTMRVWLSSIKYNNVYNLTVSGSYSIGGAPVTGSSLKVEFSGGSIYLTQNGVTTNVGTNLTLTRNSGGIKIAESLSPANTYPGDLRFVTTGGTNYVICHIYIEDYLYGVLPYEMDNTFPLEALKAQAVAARTYSAAAKKGSSLYDVTDTIDNQVFRGVNYTKTQCIQAVDATRGIVMKYNGQYIAANYTASNGGQTELNSNAWGSSHAAYFQVKDDPFDLANTSSVSKSYLIYSSPDKGSSVSANAMIREAIAQKRGGVANNYIINEITDVTVHTPKFASPSRVYTQLRVSVRYNGNVLDVVDIPLFSTVENALSLSINSASNELFTVTKESNGFRVTSRRYGHGVGMSQRGAEQMARNGYRYADILGFYYAGIQLLQVSFTFNGTSSPVVTPGPTASGGSGQTGQTTTDVKARVSLENPNNRLNLREQPNISSPVVARLAHGETVTIIGETGTWYRVSYSAAVGYVAKEYLIVQATATQTPGSSGNTSTDTAYVTLQSGMLNLRREPRATASIVGNIPNGSSVTVINKDTTWSQISYGSLTGYVMTQYLTMANPTAGNSDATAVVTLTNTNESLNMRMNPSTTSPVVMRLRHGTVLSVHERNATWSKVSTQGVVGYVMNSYVRFQGGTATAQPTYAPTAAPTVVETWKAYVTLSYGTLNMRSQPNTSSNIVVNIPNRAEVLVTQLTDTWCAVTYGSYSGYVMRRYLTIGDRYTYTATAVPTAQPTVSAGGSSGTSAWVTTASGGGVYLRGAPSENGSVLATMQTGSEVKILESDTQWTYAQYGVLTGYVATTYLTKTRPGAVSTPTQPGTSSGSGYGYIQTRSGGPVNLRQNPSTSAVVLMEVAHGTYVELISDGPQWAQVRVGSLTGYVASEYVSKTQPQAIATQAPNNNTAVVNRGTVNVGQGRVVLALLAQPDVSAQHVATVDNQTSVDVLKYAGYNAQWLQVRTGSVTGYAPRSDISLRYSVAAVSLQGSADSSISLRSSASDSASIVGTATEGTVVSVMSSDGYGWTQVMLPSGVTGYMRTALLRGI